MLVKTHLRGATGGHTISGIAEPVAGCPAGSFVNHSNKPNCELKPDPGRGQRYPGVFVIALVNIQAGHFLTINYGKDWVKNNPMVGLLASKAGGSC